LFKQVGLSLGALIELKHRDFKKIENIEDPEDGAITELFTISKIRWISVNKSMIEKYSDRAVGYGFAFIIIILLLTAIFSYRYNSEVEMEYFSNYVAIDDMLKN
jgi:hypothetical protein